MIIMSENLNVKKDPNELTDQNLTLEMVNFYDSVVTPRDSALTKKLNEIAKN